MAGAILARKHFSTGDAEPDGDENVVTLVT